MTPKWGFGVAMLPVSALCFYQAHFGRAVLPKWPLWARGASTMATLGARCFQNGHFGRISSTLYLTMFQTLGGHACARRVSHEPCFRQAHCFVQGPLRFLLVLPDPTCARSHSWGFPTPAVESSIAVEGAVENRGLYRVSVSHLFETLGVSSGSHCVKRDTVN